MTGHYAEVVKWLALGLPKAACKVLWKNDARTFLKDLVFKDMDSEIQSLCSTASPVLRGEVMQFSLKTFDEEFRNKAPLTNELLELLCTSQSQKKKKRSGGAVSKRRTEKASAVKSTTASMILNSRCPELSALATRIGLIVRHAGAGRLVSSCLIFLLSSF